MTREKSVWAARASQIHDFVMNVPKGYDTIIGEQGLRLSAGERQVLDGLFIAMRGKTSLLITHRLVKLDVIDEILVLDQGWLVERGTHDFLLGQDGLYRRLWNLQNRILSSY